jgi:hypothetical protein
MSDLMVEYNVDGYWVSVSIDSLTELMSISDITKENNND